MILGGIMTLRFFSIPITPLVKPFMPLLIYLGFMIIPSINGWDPEVSYLKLILFSSVYIAYLGVVNMIAQETMLCGGTHDLSLRTLPLLVGDTDVGKYVFIGARALVLPGANLGEGSVVGAGAVVTKDVEPWTVVGGNPAKLIKKRELKED